MPKYPATYMGRGAVGQSGQFGPVRLRQLVVTAVTSIAIPAASAAWSNVGRTATPSARPRRDHGCADAWSSMCQVPRRTTRPTTHSARRSTYGHPARADGADRCGSRAVDPRATSQPGTDVPVAPLTSWRAELASFQDRENP